MRKIFAIAVATILADCGASAETPNPNGIDPGFGSQDASGDVKLGECKADFGVLTCQLAIQNPTDGTSDYYVEASMEGV